MDNIVEFIMNGATTWTPEVFIRLLFVFAVLEGVFSLGAVLMYVAKR